MSWPTRIPDDDVSKVRIVTGLGEETILPYENVSLGNYILDYLISKQEGDYGVHFISLKTNEIVNQFLPLNDFERSVKVEDRLSEQVILLSNKEEIVGNLNITLEYPEDVFYDLSTANEIVLISLSITDTNLLDYKIENEEEWILEILEPINVTYHVTNPRFLFQYTYFYN